MTQRQKQILSVFVLLNLIVYGVLGFFAFVAPTQDRNVSRAAPNPGQNENLSRIVSLAPTETLTLRPTDAPTPTQRPTDVMSQPSNDSTAQRPNEPTPLPWQEGGSWSQSPTPAPNPTATPTKVVIVSAAPASLRRSSQPASASASPQPAAPAPSGDSPSNAMTPGDAWRTISPGASVWFKVGNGGEKIDVFLDASPLQGMSFDVFEPSNQNRPIGRGSFQNSSGMLVWSGGQVNSHGDWMARVTNGNSAPAQYKLSTTAREIARCNTYSYWEYIGPNLVYWTACR